MAAADYRLLTDATGQRMAAALEGMSVDRAAKTDLTTINATGTTNATGAAIAAGTYFYLNGALVHAKTNIASGATFTSGTNYEAVTAGGLNSLNDQIATQAKSGTFSVSANSSKELTVNQGSYGYIFSSGLASARGGVICYGYASTLAMTTLHTANGITVSVSGNKLTIGNSTSDTAYFFIISAQGNIPQ